jgi:D-3-phosphoglycerate dehydrogenase
VQRGRLVWTRTAAGSREVRGQTLGIVGYGSIGSQLSVVPEALGMRVLFHDVTDRFALGTARRCATLDELLEQSDVVSLHVDGRPENARLIGAAELARMRPGSLLLNLSRGHVVDTTALARVLRSGHLAGAALDVSGRLPERLRALPEAIRVSVLPATAVGR